MHIEDLIENRAEEHVIWREKHLDRHHSWSKELVTQSTGNNVVRC